MGSHWEQLSQAPNENTSTRSTEEKGDGSPWILSMNPQPNRKPKPGFHLGFGKENCKVKAPTRHHGEESFLLNIPSCTYLEEESVPEHQCCLQATQPQQKPINNQ